MPTERGPKGSNFLEKSRRVGKYAAVPMVVGAAILSSCREENHSQSVIVDEIPTATLPAVSPEATIFDSVLIGVEEFEGYSFRLNKDGVPTGYLKPDGSFASLNEDELVKSRDKALREGLPEVIGLLKLEVSDQQEKISLSERVFEQLPGDALTEEELLNHGVEIIQAENSQLRVRKSAFEEGGSFSHLEGKGRKLIIALVDGNAVSRGLIKDSRYDKVRHMLPEAETDTQSFLKARLNELEILVNEAEATALTSLTPEDARYFVLRAKTYREAYKSGFITEEQLGEEQAEQSAFYSGKYFSPEESGIEDTEVIFISVGRKDRKTDSVRMYFDEKGKFVVDKHVLGSSLSFDNSTFLPDYSPTVAQGFPSMEMLQKKYDGNYLYYQLTAGQLLNHELGHSVSDPDLSEQKADEHMRDKFKSQNFDFYFSLPDGSGWILTTEKTLINQGQDSF